MRDADVRATLRTELPGWYPEEPGLMVVEELGLHGGVVRVDMVAAGTWLHAYEIKSDRDTLERLPAQAAGYSDAFDTVTLVVGEHHHVPARRLVPSWWGVVVAVPVRPGLVRCYPDRPAAPSPRIRPLAMASLLWRDEGLALLRAYEADQGLEGMPRSFVHFRLTTVFRLDELRRLISAVLRSRPVGVQDPSPE